MVPKTSLKLFSNHRKTPLFVTRSMSAHFQMQISLNWINSYQKAKQTSKSSSFSSIRSSIRLDYKDTRIKIIIIISSLKMISGTKSGGLPVFVKNTEKNPFQGILDFLNFLLRISGLSPGPVRLLRISTKSSSQIFEKFSDCISYLVLLSFKE